MRKSKPVQVRNFQIGGGAPVVIQSMTKTDTADVDATVAQIEEMVRAAKSLPTGEALLLRGNGALTLGGTPGLAVARMWLLSAACEACLATQAGRHITPLTAEEIASWRDAAAELLPRLWHHLQRHGGSRP